MAVRFMMLMPWGRVGSNLLLHILEQSARIKTDNEGLIHVCDADAQLEWVASFYELNSNCPSRPFIGSKQNMRSICDVGPFTTYLIQSGIRIVRLRRDNYLKAAVSQIRAEQYAEKTRRESGVARWGVLRGQTPLGVTPIDIDMLIQRIRTIEEQQQRLIEAFLASEVFDIEYDDIQRSLEDVVRRLRDYLEMPQKPFVPKYDKATPDDLPDAILNYSELKQRLADTAYSEFLQ